MEEGNGKVLYHVFASRSFFSVAGTLAKEENGSDPKTKDWRRIV